MYFQSKGKDEVTYDAIVVGSGLSGGWAAKELTEKGLNVLDAGHFDTEKVFPQAMSRFIRRRITELGDIDIIESGADVNPFEYR